MIQFNLQSETISGYFNIPPERKLEIDQEFKNMRDEQRAHVLADIMKSIDESGVDKIGYHRVPVLNAFMKIAKNESEQAYVAFMAHHELAEFTKLMNMAVQGTLSKLLLMDTLFK